MIPKSGNRFSEKIMLKQTRQHPRIATTRPQAAHVPTKNGPAGVTGGAKSREETPKRAAARDAAIAEPSAMHPP
jgi:hypothetical protein